jgi:hypothetical protein
MTAPDDAFLPSLSLCFDVQFLFRVIGTWKCPHHCTVSAKQTDLLHAIEQQLKRDDCTWNAILSENRMWDVFDREFTIYRSLLRDNPSDGGVNCDCSRNFDSMLSSATALEMDIIILANISATARSHRPQR